MAEEFVNRTEFNMLKEKVYTIEKDMVESSKLLQEIDKKIDVISEKIGSSDEINDLKIKPLEEKVKSTVERVKDLEDGKKWLTRAILAELIGTISAVILVVVKTLL